MVADYNTIPRIYSYCKKQYFDNKLLTPQFGVIHTFRILARFEFHRGNKGASPKHPTILVSDYFDLDEPTFINIMVHEMIHYYLMVNGIDVKCTHGKAFMAMAKEMNEKYGLNVTKTMDASQIPNSPSAPKRTWWRQFHL